MHGVGDIASGGDGMLRGLEGVLAPGARADDDEVLRVFAQHGHHGLRVRFDGGPVRDRERLVVDFPEHVRVRAVVAGQALEEGQSFFLEAVGVVRVEVDDHVDAVLDRGFHDVPHDALVALPVEHEPAEVVDARRHAQDGDAPVLREGLDDGVFVEVAAAPVRVAPEETHAHQLHLLARAVLRSKGSPVHPQRTPVVHGARAGRQDGGPARRRLARRAAPDRHAVVHAARAGDLVLVDHDLKGRAQSHAQSVAHVPRLVPGVQLAHASLAVRHAANVAVVRATPNARLALRGPGLEHVVSLVAPRTQ
mmetsp:Transcript_27815/g.85333  ORF Transcript_27815/g.85333 Transcript_27815/m.85333 type:complete len:307 (+) Transcript_27815:739-1659(+)